MKKKDDFCRESNHFLKSVCLALCLISSGGSAVYAATLQTEQTTLTVRMNNCTIKDVFDHIEKNSEFVFVYHGANIDLHRRVNLDVRDKSVEVILERMLNILSTTDKLSYEGTRKKKPRPFLFSKLKKSRSLVL